MEEDVMAVTSGSGSPSAFVSYSHHDAESAKQFAERLRVGGVAVWLDEWEIQPGDSVVDQIFEKGLKSAKVFVILLSKASVQSRWVRHELDVAVVNRIEWTTRIVPVLIEECEIPVALRPLRHLRLGHGLDEIARRIVDVAFERFPERPSVGPRPEARLQGVKPRSGLSSEATTVGASIVRSLDLSRASFPYFSAGKVARASELDPERLNDAVDELVRHRLVKLREERPGEPHIFSYLMPTYALVHLFADHLDGGFDLVANVKQVAAAIASTDEAEGRAISERLGMPAARVNHAVGYLGEAQIIRTLRESGVPPYWFSVAIATPATRRLWRSQIAETLPAR
jgi:hypothetical protein